MRAYVQRMRAYLAEMFPLGRHVVIAAATYLATAAFARHAHGLNSSLLTAYLPLGVWSYLAVPMMLRLMDELKDADIDRELFPDRPLPSGRVGEADIRASLAAVIGMFMMTNAVHATTLAAASAITGYSLLMFKRFFAGQALRNSLPLTLITHNPIVPMSLCYGFFLFSAEQGVPLMRLRWSAVFLFVVMLWMPFLAWELSRKIRAPEEEDAYVTYTQLLGRRGAVAALSLTQLVGIAAAAGLCLSVDASWLLLFLPAVSWLVTLWAGERFVANPTPDNAKLRPFAEGFTIATIASALLVFGLPLL